MRKITIALLVFGLLFVEECYSWGEWQPWPPRRPPPPPPNGGRYGGENPFGIEQNPKKRESYAKRQPMGGMRQNPKRQLNMKQNPKRAPFMMEQRPKRFSLFGLEKRSFWDSIFGFGNKPKRDTNHNGNNGYNGVGKFHWKPK